MAVNKQILGKVVITNKDEYNSSNTYEILDVVSYKGSSYLSKIDNNTSVPTDEEKWQVIAKKGDTYEVTEKDLQAIAKQITDDANSIFNTNVNSKTKTFNENSEEKLSTFNANARTKLNDYNSNAKTKLDDYNANDTSKLKAYNDNATSALEVFNTNASTKLIAYNDNTVEKLAAYNNNANSSLKTYNDNATTKTDTFDTNAENKTDAFNTNAQDKTDEFNSTANAEKITSLSNEFYRVKDNILETGEVTDTSIHLEDSALAEMQGIEIEGVTEQNTTTGRNLFVATDNLSLVRTGRVPTNLTLKVDKNEISYKTVQDGFNGPYFDKTSLQSFIKDVDLAQEYYISADITVDKSTSYKFGWETSGEQKGNLQPGTTRLVSKATPTTAFVCYINSNNTNVKISNFMISKTVGNYETYTNGTASPSPNCPQQIKNITDKLVLTSFNKNLFKMNDNFSMGYAIEKNGITLKIEDDLSISLKGTATNAVEFFLFGNWGAKNNSYLPKNKNTISQVGLVDGITSNLGFFNNGNNVGNYGLTHLNTTCVFDLSLIEFDGMSYALSVANGKTVNTRIYIQIESGIVSTSFVQHLQSQIEANLPEGEFVGKIDDTYKDTLRTQYFPEEGKYHLMLDKMVGMGDTSKYFGNVKRISTKQKNYRFTFDINIDKIPKSDTGADATYPLYCDKFIKGSRAASYSEINSISYGIGVETYAQFVLYYSEISGFTQNQFSDWLTNNPLIIYYILQTPYTLDLGVIDMPLSYNEVTNIFTNSDLMPNINVKYYRNFTKTIQNLQVNEKALKDELIDINNRLSALESTNANTTDDTQNNEDSEVTEE